MERVKRVEPGGLDNMFFEFLLFIFSNLKYPICLFLTDRAGADPEILKRGSALCRSPWLAGEENFRFQMV